MKRGDIRYYVFTPPDKKRLVIVLSRDSIIPYLGEVTIAPITSTIRGIPSEVLLSEADGMPKNCVINFDHMQTVPKDKIGKLITTLPLTKMASAKSALLFALGFDG
jgi:mRNA interferase MazF